MNPLLQKDVLIILRMRRIAAIQIAFIAVLAGLVLYSWPPGGLLTLSAGKSDDLLLAIMLGQMGVLLFTIPGVAGVSLTVEFEANTFEMLYASRMTALQIATGKILAAVAFPALLLVSGLPFVALLAFRGSLNFHDLGWAYLLLVLTAFLVAIVSMTISSVCRKSGTALVLSYLLILTGCLGVLVPAAILLAGAPGSDATLLHDLRVISPVAAMLSLLRPNMAGDFAGVVSGNTPSHLLFVPAAAVIGLIGLVIVVFRLRHPPAENNPYTGVDKRAVVAVGSRNPLYVKEKRTNPLLGGPWMMRTFYGLVALSLLLALMGLNGGAEQPDLLRYVFTVLVALQLGGIAVVIPSLTAPMISSELEADTFEMVRQSRVTAGEFFRGKLLAALGPALLPTIALLPAYGILLVVNPGYLWYTLAVLPILLAATVLCAIIGLVCSAYATATARASTTAYLVVIAVFALPALPWYAQSAGLLDSPVWVARVSAISPLVAALGVVPAAASGAVTTSPGPHLIFVGGIVIVLLIVARYRIGNLLQRG